MSDDWWKEDQATAAPAAADDSWWQEDATAPEESGGLLGPPLSEGPRRGRIAPPSPVMPVTPQPPALSDPISQLYARGGPFGPYVPDPTNKVEYGPLVGESIRESVGEEFTLPSGSDWWNSLRGSLARTLQGYELGQLEDIESDILGREFPAFRDGDPTYSRTPAELRELQDDPLLQTVRGKIAEVQGAGREMTAEAQEIAARNPGYWPKVVMGSTNSLAMSAPSLAATMTTRNPLVGAAMMFPTTEASAYGEMREQDVPIGTAQKAAAIEGLIEAGTELPALSPFARGASPMMRKLGETLAADVPGETIATLGQSLTRQMALQHPNETAFDAAARGLEEGLGELPVTYGTVFATAGAQSAMARGIEAAKQEAERRSFKLTPPTPDDIQRAETLRAIEALGPMSPGGPFTPDPNVQPDLPLGTMDEPAITGSRAPVEAGGKATAPIPPPSQGTATPPAATPLSTAFERPVPAAPPATPAPQEPAPAPAPAAPAVSTATEPPAGGAAPSVEEEAPEVATSLNALLSDPAAPVRRYTMTPMGLTTEDSPPWKDAGSGWQSREYVTEVGDKRYPVQEIKEPGGKRYQRGYDLEGKPFNELPPKIGKVFDQTFVRDAPAAQPAPATAPAPAPVAEVPQSGLTPAPAKPKKAPKAKKPEAPPAPAPVPVAETPAEPESPPQSEEEAESDVEREKAIREEKRKQAQIKKDYRELRKADPEFERIAAFVGDEPQHADLGMLQGWRDAKAGTPLDPERVRSMLPTSDMKPHGFNPIQRYLTGYAAALGLNPHDLRSFDVQNWVDKIEAGRAPKNKGIVLDKRETVTTAAGTKVETQFEVIEAADLVTSDNRQFPKEVQPRERGSRVASAEQISKMAGSIDPDLLGSNPHAENGAPIIGKDDNVVESGNGRVMALRQMYARNPELSGKYADFILREFGQDVSQMKAPILVRRRISDVDRVKFAREANKTAVAKMSAAEQSKMDQDALTPAVMGKLPDELGEGFDLGKAEGTPFVNAFVATFPPAERGDLVDADGKPSQQAVQRATAALLTKAYGGSPAGEAAIRRAVESKGGDAQTVVKTLVRFAPGFAKLRDDIAAGRVQDQADIGPQIAEAVEVVRNAAGPGDITNWLRTDDLLTPKDETVKQLVQTFYQLDGRGDAKRISTAKTIADTLSAYLRLAQQYRPEQAGGGLFGEEAAMPVINPAAELGKINAARQAKEQVRERQEGAQGGLFTASGQPRAAVSVGARDAGSRTEEQPTGPDASRYDSDLEASETGEETLDLVDELRRPKRRKFTRQPGPYSVTREGEIRASALDAIWTDAGLNPDTVELMPPAARFRKAAEIVQARFGFRSITKDTNLNLQDAIDALKDAYVGLSNFASIQNINPSVLSLNGRLALELHRQKEGALAYYNPGTKTIGMVRRNDAFAHEWAHALDHWLVETFAPEMLERQGRHLTGKTRTGGTAETMDEQVREAFVNVLNAMFFDGAKAALYVADLEKKIAGAKTDKVRAKFEAMLENFRAGHSKATSIESQYYKAAKAMDQRGPEGGSKEGYWQRPTEMFARAFEAYIANKLDGLPADHPFVTMSDRMYNEGRIGTMRVPYPQQSDRDNVFSAMDTLMRAMRDRSLVDTGNAPNAIQPTDTRYWKKLAPQLAVQAVQQARGVVGRMAESIKRQLAETHRADHESRERDKVDQRVRDVRLDKWGLSGRRRWLANQGIKAIEKTTAIPRALAETVRGFLLSLDAKHKGNAGVAWLRGVFATDPGSSRYTGAVWSEEVRHWDRMYQNRFAAIVKKHDVNGFDDAELRQLRDVLVNAVPSTKVPDKVSAAAADMRRFLNDLYAYNVSNGVNIGYAKNGYLPRIIDSLVVENDLDGFRTQARALYSRVYGKELGSLDAMLADLPDNQKGLRNLIQYVREIARDGNLPEARLLANDLLEPAKRLADALDELQEAADEDGDTAALEDEIADLAGTIYSGLREPWSMEAANDWEMRIRGLGAEPDFAFEARGPDGKYTKSRVLPEETDAIMGEYLKNDPLELITTYVSQSVRRVQFGKFFGNPTKDKPLGWKLNDAMHAARLPYKAQNGKTVRMSEDDFEELQKSVELLVGRHNHSMTKRGLRWKTKLTAVLTPVVLARSLMSQIAEPIVTARTTGDIRDAFGVFYKQMQDVAGKLGLKGAKEQAAWRREMAEYFGIVADHMADQLMIQRYNLMDLNSSDRVKMARFFHVIGVHPHAVSMRRAVAEIFMTRYAPKMAQRALGQGPQAVQARGALAELGIDSSNRELLGELQQLGNIKDTQQLDSLRHINQIRTAINRFTDTAIQDPKVVDKPRMASMPEYSFMYGILSFQFAFQRNVLIAGAKQIKNAWKNDAKIGAATTASIAATLSLLVGAQLAAWIARSLMFGKEDWDELEKKISEDWLWQSISRAGLFGAGDPIVNAFLGLKYERDLSQMMAGPLLSIPLGVGQDLGTAALRNSQNTATAEYNSAEAIWKGVVAPYVASKALSIAGANPWLDAVLGVGLAYLTSPVVTSNVAEVTAETITGQEYKPPAKRN